MSLHWEQFKALHKKDWLIRKRHWIVSILEFFLPIALVWCFLYASQDRVKSSTDSTSLKRIKRGFFDRGSFTCNIGTIYYAPTINSSAVQFLSNAEPGCIADAVGFKTEYDLAKAWGNLMKPYGYSFPSVFIFKSLDLDQRTANYFVKNEKIRYEGPWTEYNFWNDFTRLTGSLFFINYKLATYPNTTLFTDQWRYSYTGSLFDQGNPGSSESSSSSSSSGASPSPINPRLANIFPSLMITILIVSTLIVRRIVKEKSTNGKELLRIMGMSDSVYWISHFVNYLILSIFHGTLITILLSVYSSKNPFDNWNAGLFFISYLIVAISTIFYSFTLTTVLNRPIIGVLIAMTGTTFLTYLPIASALTPKKFLGISSSIWTCLTPNGALYYSLDSMINKASWSTLFKSSSLTSLGPVWLTAILSWFVYLFLIWYVGSVWPWQNGTPKPWYFPFSVFIRTRQVDIEINELRPFLSEYHEPLPDGLVPSIRCSNLYRAFGSLVSKKFAVNGLNLDIMKGQITALLGHNGAGKTTTMAMITGIFPPTSGCITVNGINVQRDVATARRCLALCPQHEVLFEELTVQQNLELCAGLRGLSSEKKKELIPLNLQRVQLTEKANSLASNLSGGMRRRLQLALALVTASEILILDEPTSGLDPESRRQVWDLLLELRKSLTILLTTHFMEEADALGDRIVIMASGKVKCSGSPMFLKNKLGAGHLLRIAKEPWSYDSDKLSAHIKNFFSQSEIISESNEEIVYRLKHYDQSVDPNSVFPDLCDNLDEYKSECGINSYGISVATLEDVFLKVTVADEDFESLNSDNTTQIRSTESPNELDSALNYTKLTGKALSFQKFRGLFMKRFHFAKRYSKFLIFTCILPSLAMLFTFYVSQTLLDPVSNALYYGYPKPIKLNAREIYGENKGAVIRILRPSSYQSDFVKAYVNIVQESGMSVKFINASLTLDQYQSTNSDSAEFMRKYLFGIIEIDTAEYGEIYNFKMWYNTDATLSLPLTADAFTNAMIRAKSGLKASRTTVTIEQMPNAMTDLPEILTNYARTVSVIISSFAFCFLSTSYFLFPSIESNVKANLIQKMSGTEPVVLWLSNFTFDFAYHFLVSLVMISITTIFDNFAFSSLSNFAAILLLFLLYGLASMGLSYLASFLPLSPDGGFALLTLITLVGTVTGSTLLALLASSVEPFLLILSIIFPPFSASYGFSKIYAGSVHYRTCLEGNGCSPGNNISREICCDIDGNFKIYDQFSWSGDGIAPQLTLLILEIFILIVLLIALDTNLHRVRYLIDRARKSLYSPGIIESVDDDDVIAERERVKQICSRPGQTRSEALIVNNLTKDFKNFRAVDNLCFTVHSGECFGLLGVNGAGKTTTFKMLTGDALITEGDAFVKLYSLRHNIKQFQQSISYCPQYDALLGNLTPEETLTLFARIRGTPEDKVTVNVKHIINSTDLTVFAKTKNQNLSGGNKRKLSLAVAAIGKPEIIFLDEPTTGVDPASRRKIWSTLVYLREKFGCSIVLTSHSMDECETLCARIGIMARGKFKCIGSSQYLKQKFGQGFTLIVKLKQEALSAENVQTIATFISNKLKSAVLRDYHQTILHYHITDPKTRLGDIYRAMGEAKRNFPIEDFTLTGTTLEQIFLSFAEKQ